MCARSAPKIFQNALVLLRNITGIIKSHIHDNHIEFEVSGHFGGVWPTGAQRAKITEKVHKPP